MSRNYSVCQRNWSPAIPQRKIPFFLVDKIFILSSSQEFDFQISYFICKIQIWVKVRMETAYNYTVRFIPINEQQFILINSGNKKWKVYQLNELIYDLR